MIAILNFVLTYIAAKKSKNSTTSHALISHLENVVVDELTFNQAIAWPHQALTLNVNRPDVRRHMISLSHNKSSQLIFTFSTRSVSNASMAVMAFLQHAKYNNSVSHMTICLAFSLCPEISADPCGKQFVQNVSDLLRRVASDIFCRNSWHTFTLSYIASLLRNLQHD